MHKAEFLPGEFSNVLSNEGSNTPDKLYLIILHIYSLKHVP